MNRHGYITPSRFKDVMTVGKSFKTKDELKDELEKLVAEQEKRIQSKRTSTAVFKDTEARIKELPSLIDSWNPETRFGDTSLTYATEVALGRFGISKGEASAASLEWGKSYESEARTYYEQISGNSFPAENMRMVSEEFPYIAGEADGIINGDRIGEIKCPYNPLKHYETITDETIYETYKYQPPGYAKMYNQNGFTLVSYHPAFPNNGKIWYKDFDLDTSLQDDLFNTIVLFEEKIVRPMVEKMENEFNAKQTLFL